jgi:hypothetical protein
MAQYHASIPYTYKYRVAVNNFSALTSSSTSGSGTDTNNDNNGSARPSETDSHISLTSKSLSYLPALQLALSAFPGSLIAAVVGWTVGYAYRNEVLPGASGWRVPGWVVGESGKTGEGYEGLRRRLDGESRSVATGRSNVGATGGEERRRTLGGMVGEMFGGEGS